MNDQQTGPNVKRLIVRRMALLLIPVGSGKDSVTFGIEALTNPGRLSATVSEASAWVRRAIAAVKTAPDNPYGNDDEVIAGVLLRDIEGRERTNARTKKQT
jgi:hypothetical protein